MTNTPIKWHGGKHYLATRIIELMPEHIHYVEPYFGGGSVLLHKNPIGVSEVVNDICGELMNFWRVLRSDDTFHEFARIIQTIPFSKPEWELSKLRGSTSVREAVNFFVRCRQSRAGQCNEFAPITRNRLRRNMNEQCSAWMSCVEGLPEVHARMMRVVLLCEDAIDTIKSQDGPNTLFYIDPPYLHSTRVSTEVYTHEMTEDDHKEMLNTLNQVTGKVIISGYPSDLYETYLKGWRTHDINMPNHVAGGKSKRRMIERLWMNY